MIPAIVFRAGHSGHYLRAIILDYPADESKFRMKDFYQQNDIFLTHDVDLVINNPKYFPVFRILPTDNVYNAMYNIFMKKILVEEFPNFNLTDWISDPMFWYDKCYYHIREYYTNIKQDIQTNTISNVVDFDRLTNSDYIEQWLTQNFNTRLTSNQKKLIENYSALQLGIELKDDSTQTMQEILSPLTDTMLLENPWFWAYAVFKFEHNNNLLETDRLWSVDSFVTPQTVEDLLSYQYNILK